jgi:hypothetical protein
MNRGGDDFQLVSSLGFMARASLGRGLRHAGPDYCSGSPRTGAPVCL